MDRASHCGIEQSRRYSAVDDADWVVVILSRFNKKNRAALTHFGDAKVHERAYGGRRQFAGDNLLQVFHSRQTDCSLCEGAWVFPGYRARSGVEHSMANPFPPFQSEGIFPDWRKGNPGLSYRTPLAFKALAT